MTSNKQTKFDTVCINCVNDSDLKVFIEHKGTFIETCTICNSKNIKAIEFQESGEFSQAVRSLVRFYYNEWDYNGHFGGEHIEKIIFEEKLFFSDQFFANEDKADEILATIFYEGYYDPGKGVSLFYGHTEDGGYAGFYFAIQKARNRYLENIEIAMVQNDYRRLFSIIKEVIDVCEHLLTAEYQGLNLFRARIGVLKTGVHMDDGFGEPFPPLRCTPFSDKEIGAPPFDKAETGRMNRAGFSFLYLAEDVKTAITEVRPAPGDLVSVGIFAQLQSISVLDFAKLTIRDFWTTDNALEVFTDIYGIAKYVSSHFGTNGKHNYLFTQLMSEELIRRGFQGIRHASSFTSKPNYVIFNPSLFTNLSDKASAVEIKDIDILFENMSLLNEAEAVPQSIK